jgi:ABC-2 type transport system permease protein
LLLLREPVAIFFSLAFPMVIYFFIGAPYANEQIEPGVKFIDVMFPTLIGTVGANLLLMGMPVYFAELRARGVDRRYRALPLPGVIFALAIIGAMLLLVASASALIIAVVGFAHGLRRTTQAISAALFFIMFFGSGAAAPLEGLPAWLQTITEFNPLRHWFDLLTGVYTSAEIPEGTFVKALLVIPVAAAIGFLGLYLTKRSSN